jgi:hypothetical protein
METFASSRYAPAVRSAWAVWLSGMLVGCPSSTVPHDAGEDAALRDGGAADTGVDPDACGPRAESCDGIDNDCDALVDEAPDSLCMLAHAESTCAEGACAIVECEGYFADCNGDPLDGCETDRATDPASCGTCGRACGAAETCEAGLCDPERFTYITSGVDHQCALRADRRVMCWGANGRGQLGDGTRTSSRGPVFVSGVDDAVAIGTTSRLSCALLAGGRLVCWGTGPPSYLEDGFHEVPTPAPLVDLALGALEYQAVCGVTATGAVYCAAGNDNSGIYGDRAPCGCIHGALEPVEGISNARVLSLTTRIFCARSEVAEAICWGRDVEGMNPARVDLPAPVSKIAGGMSIHVCALLESGAIWCWGSNGGGAIALPAAGELVGPTQIAGLGEPAIDVAVGYVMSCAVLASGAVSCWGTNHFGNLGHEPGDPPLEAEGPTVVAGVRDVVQVAPSMASVYALHRSGAVTGWGVFAVGDDIAAPQPFWGLP